MNHKIEIRHLKCFLATAEELHITRAAERLDISQPTLSQTIRDLERIIGIPLFDRVGRRIRLTVAGNSFRISANRILEDINRTFDMISDLRGGRGGVLRIGAVPVLAEAVLPPLVAAYHREFPEVQLTIENNSSQRIEQRLLSGSLDFGVIYGAVESDELIVERLYTESFVLACSRKNPLAQKKQIKFADVLLHPLVITPREYLNRRLLETAAHKIGKKLRVAMEFNDVQIMMDVAALTDLVTVVTAQAGNEHSGLAVIPIVDPSLNYDANLVWHRDQYRTAAARLFAARLKSALLARVEKFSSAGGKSSKKNKKSRSTRIGFRLRR